MHSHLPQIYLNLVFLPVVVDLAGLAQSSQRLGGGVPVQDALITSGLLEADE